MSDPFLAEIRLFSGNFAPTGWALCDGRLLPIAQNTALFSLLGTSFGGDGRQTFALPDLRGRSPMHPGAGPGLTPRTLGEAGGEEAVTLTLNEMPSHTHRLAPSVIPASDVIPAGTFIASPPAARIYGPPGNLLAMSPAAIRPVGGEPHDNRQPYLALNFIIALQGIFPARS
jgi:microcystin-dependent protein